MRIPLLSAKNGHYVTLLHWKKIDYGTPLSVDYIG